MKATWNNRFSNPQYIYGVQPNAFFKKVIDKLPIGSVLLPAEGEGRNAVYAATRGWSVEAFDQSDIAQAKAYRLAEEASVHINYQVFDFKDIANKYENNKFDLIGLTYAHLPPDVRVKAFRTLAKLLKKDGLLVLECFSKNQTLYQTEEHSSGGPQNKSLLYSKEEIPRIFSEQEAIYLKEEVISLDEGSGHQGKASVIRYIGRKKDANIFKYMQIAK